VAGKITDGKQRKRLFFYLLAMVMIVTVSYVIFEKLGWLDPWAGTIVAMSVMATATGLFANGGDWIDKGGNRINYRNVNRRFPKDDD